MHRPPDLRALLRNCDSELLERLGAASLLTLGALVMLGWLMHIPALVSLRDGYVAMVFNTAFCFTLISVAVLTRRRLLRTGLACFVLGLAAVVFLQYVLGVDLGVDHLFDGRWADPSNPYPGRMAPQTALCFVFASLALLLLEQSQRKWAYTLAQVLVLIVGVAGILSLIGYSLRLELLYSWHRYTRMALHTAAGFTVLSIALWMLWYRVSTAAGEFIEVEERRLNVVGTALIVLLTTTAGAVGFVALAKRTEMLALQNVSASLEERVQALEAFVHERAEDAQLIATRPRVRSFVADPGFDATAPQRIALNEILQSLLRGHVNAIRVYARDGELLAAAGDSVGDARISIELAPGIRLLSRDAPHLEFELPIELDGATRGRLIVQSDFSVLERATAASSLLSETGDLRLCAALSSTEMQCLPTRLAEAVQRAPRSGAHGALPISLALDGASGAGTSLNLHNRQSIGAHAPFMRRGVGVALMHDSEDVYAPIRESLQTLLIVLSLVAAAGVLLLRSQMAPLLRDAMHSRITAAATNARTAAILDNVPDGVITIDARGVIVSVNPAVSRMFGYSERELLGASVKLLMPAAMHGPHEAGFARYLASQEPRLIGRGPLEAPARRADGHEFPIELTLNTMEMNGERFFVGIMHDITRRREVERLKNEFVSVVSHELRTPLTSIRGSLGLVNGGAAGVLPPKAQQLIELAWRNTDRLTSLVNDILDVEKIESGHMQFDLSRQMLRPLLEQALEMNAGYAHTHRTAFVLVEPVPEAAVYVDPQRLLQVLANLLSNAAKFSPPDSEVRIAATIDGGACRIAVIDRGPGVPRAFQGRLFQKFSQADGSDGRQKGGTGLGLAISKALIERMGGEIGFESPGVGAMFWIELPLDVSPAVNPPRTMSEGRNERLAPAAQAGEG